MLAAQDEELTTLVCTTFLFQQFLGIFTIMEHGTYFFDVIMDLHEVHIL